MLALKDMVAKGKVVRFVCLMAESLWYETEDGFTFPVPLSETPGAAFLAEDKAMMYMRHIRKFMPAASGLEGGLAKSVAQACEGPTVSFRHFRENEFWYATADGFEFPVPAGARATLAAVESADQFADIVAAHRSMLSQARLAA
jgi:hypothetical protein